MAIQLSPEIERRQQFGALLNWRNLKREAAEIGTDQGVFAAQFLQGWRGLNLVCIDPWREIPDYKDKRIWGDRDSDLQFAIANLARFAGRVRLRRTTAEEAVGHYPDGFFDFVYDDSDHAYPIVKKHLSLYWPKLQAHGIYAGHDFDRTEMPGVVQAVTEFAEAHDLNVWLTNEPCFKSWYVYKTAPRMMFQSFEHISRTSKLEPAE